LTGIDPTVCPHCGEVTCADELAPMASSRPHDLLAPVVLARATLPQVWVECAFLHVRGIMLRTKLLMEDIDAGRKLSQAGLYRRAHRLPRSLWPSQRVWRSSLLRMELP